MQKNSVLLLAALSATCLLPMSGAFAQNDANSTSTTVTTETTTAPSGSVMDVTQFRDSLNQVRDLFTQMRENRRLALASQDSLTSSQYQELNRGLLVKALGILDRANQVWRSSSVPTDVALAPDTPNRFGTANAVRFAAESEDTAWVRNTVWQLQDQLLADKLNGRGAVITDQMMSQIDSAIERANNPSFRLARAMNEDILNQKIQLSEAPATTTTEETTTTTTTTPPPTTEESTTTTQETTPPPATEESTTTTQETTPAPAPTSETVETTETRTGAANLPKTGGDPGMLFFLGTGISALGLVLRKKR